MGNSLLLHVCCGPCASASVSFFRREVAGEVTGFFFNPNIHPFLEYRRRLAGVHDMAHYTRLEVIEDLTFDPAAWFAALAAAEKGGGPEQPAGALSRCASCLGLRLARTAEEAAARGYAAFSTTLSISPWQDHEAIQAVGQRAAEIHGVEFSYRDLRDLYSESVRLSRSWGLYRQKYCGCLLSEWERYRDR
jgi:predicted adenine nucleotide alpha hydrolase (AANH) superfamily ATPase